jgi:hypothetical protein
LGLLVVAVLVSDVLIVSLGGKDDAKAVAPLVLDIRAPSTQPQLRAAAQQPTTEGATAFALFWFDTLNWSLTHADDDLLVSHTSAGCRLCTGWLIGINRWKAQGRTLRGGLSYPLNLAVGPFSTTGPVTFAADFVTTPAALVAPDGTAERFPGGRTRGGLTVLWANGRWQMTDIVLDVHQAGATP